MFWTADTGIDGHDPVDLDELDDLGLVPVNPLPPWAWYQDMADFCGTIGSDLARQRLARAIQGKGAFRRFKDELRQRYPDLLPDWHAFRDDRARHRAVCWLVDNDLLGEQHADRFLAGEPGPAQA